jgi:class 3 adenylate cyclase
MSVASQPPLIVSYTQVWQAALRNMLIGILVSVVPAVAFYQLAFDYTAEQFRLLMPLAAAGTVVFLTVDVWILALTLRPVKRALKIGASAAEIERGIVRLWQFPNLVLPRTFGPHALFATVAVTLLIIWANRNWGLGIPERTFPIYWLLNLTIVPVGHALYEYHAAERLIAQPLSYLKALSGSTAEPPRGAALRLSVRILFFTGLLSVAPLVVVVLVISQRTTLPEGLFLQLIAVGATLALLWFFLLLLVSRELGEQTRAITSVLGRIAEGDLEAKAGVFSTSEFGIISRGVNHMGDGLRERQRIRDLFGAYLTSDLAAQLLNSPDAAHTERRNVTVMIADIRDFTALSTRYPAEAVVEILNSFFEPATAAIAERGGHVNKFLGDGLLAVFGAPLALEAPSDAALQAALQIRCELAALNQQFTARDWPQLKMGVAIHTGEVIVGTIGSRKHKLEYTVVGEAVNLASRIEALNKEFGTEILLSRQTADGLQQRYELRSLGPQPIRGLPRPIEILTPVFDERLPAAAMRTGSEIAGQP